MLDLDAQKRTRAQLGTPMQTKLPNRQDQKPDGMQDASITNPSVSHRCCDTPRMPATTSSTSAMYSPDNLECMQRFTNMRPKVTIVCKQEHIHMQPVQLELTCSSRHVPVQPSS